jgi:serine/threonine-protein kinase
MFVLVFSILGLWMGMRSTLYAALPVGAWLVAAVVGFLVARRPQPQALIPLPMIAATGVALACTSTVFGPLFFLPSLAAINALGFITNPYRERRFLMLAIGCASFLVPAVLEWAGVLPPSFAFRDGALVLLPRAVSFPPIPTIAFLVFGNLMFIAGPTLFLARVRDDLTRFEERLHFSVWQMRQMLPPDAPREAAAPPLPDSECTFERLAALHRR